MFGSVVGIDRLEPPFSYFVPFSYVLARKKKKKRLNIDKFSFCRHKANNYPAASILVRAMELDDDKTLPQVTT